MNRIDSPLITGTTVRALCGCASLVLVSGCSLLTGNDCVDLGVPALAVQVVDQRTGAPAAAGAIVVARDGTYADSLAVRDDIVVERVELAIGRPGIYSLTIRKAGYKEWSRADLVAAKRDCGVATQSLMAQLEASTP